MKTVKIDLPTDIKELELVPFADLHIGDAQCDYELIKERIEHVKNTPNAYCVLNGDIINNATKTSVSDTYGEVLSPMEQITKFVELFEPIKDKILAITSGNHENRTYIREGINITEVCARQLGLSKRFASEGIVIFLRFGEQGRHYHNRKMVYVIYMTHGSGGGRKEGSKANRLAEMSSIIDADIYIHSHTHLPLTFKNSYFRTDVRNSRIEIVDQLFVNTSSYLNYGGYGQAFEFKPNSKETPTIWLSGTKRHFRATL